MKKSVFTMLCCLFAGLFTPFILLGGEPTRISILKNSRYTLSESVISQNEGPHKVQFTTGKNKGDKISIGIKANGDVALNGLKGTFEQNKIVEYEVEAQVFSIQGDITSLICKDGNLTSLDVSKLPNLETLQCGSNSLTSLDLSNNRKIKILWCNDNNLTKLEIASPVLDQLVCHKNQLTSIDLSKQTELTQIMIGENPIKSLDLKHQAKLMALDCSDSNITELSIEGCQELVELSCSQTQLTHLNLSKSPKLENINCSKNKLTELLFPATNSITSLDCSNNQLKQLDLSHATALSELYCQGNRLQHLDLTTAANLASLACDNNQLESLTIGANKLTAIWCYSNQLTDGVFQSIVNKLNDCKKSKGFFYIVNGKDANEKNSCSKETVAKAKAKNWLVQDYDNGSNKEVGIPYEGVTTNDVAPLHFSASSIIQEEQHFATTGPSDYIVSVQTADGSPVANQALPNGIYIITLQTSEGQRIVKGLIR